MDLRTVKGIVIDTKGEYKIETLTMKDRHDPKLNCVCEKFSTRKGGGGSSGPYDHDGKSCFVLHYISHNDSCSEIENPVKPDGDTYQGTIWFLKNVNKEWEDCAEADIERLRTHLTRIPNFWNTYCIIT